MYATRATSEIMRQTAAFIAIGLMLVAQAQEHYEVTPVELSPQGIDFAPVLMDSAVVMCSLRDQGTVVVRNAETGDPLTDLYKFDWNSGHPSQPELLSKELTSIVNDGPATFCKEGTIVCITRNQYDGKDKRYRKVHQLGLFLSSFNGGHWSAPTAFEHNSTAYNLMHPAFSADGTRLFFASDMPGGLGGTDLYRSELVDGRWTTPVNLGPGVNSDRNELFPFIAATGILYFSSDRMGGLGKLDIHQCLQEGREWSMPVPMPEPLNSTGNDIGYTSFRTDRSGFLSSDRSGMERIYAFRRMPVLFTDCQTQLENNYCYAFREPKEFTEMIKGLPVHSRWVLGDGVELDGTSAEHCYPGPGTYKVELRLIDDISGEVFFAAAAYDLLIEDIRQPYISSADTVRAGRPARLNGLQTNLPGRTVEEYHWDLGDGTRAEGATIDHTWSNPGDHEVRMTVVFHDERTRTFGTACVSRTVNIVRRFEDSEDAVHIQYQDASGNVHSFSYQELPFDLFALATKDNEDVRFSVKLVESTERLDLNDSRLAEIRKYYPVTERFDPVANIYIYSVGQARNLKEMYEVFKKVLELRFLDAEVAAIQPDKVTDMSVLEMLPATELNNSLVRASTVLFDNGKDTYDPVFNAQLDKLVLLLDQHPGLRVVIEAHTDDVGSNASNISLSQRRAQRILEYLSAHAAAERLIPIGFGEEHPIADNATPEGRALNRRVDFRLVLQDEQAFTPKDR